MSDVLCIYYSFSGNTRRAMKEIAQQLDAEIVAIDDGADRNGFSGFMSAGRDAMRRSTAPLKPFTTDKPIEEYKMVIVGSPVWAGRCSSVIRGFLKRRGKEPRRVAYIITRESDERRYEEVYDQMDQYTAKPRLCANSLRVGYVGYEFWRDKFVADVKAFLEQ